MVESGLRQPDRSAVTIPEILHGWGVRPSDWQFGVSIQHEILPRTSVEVGYNRRWFHNFRSTDNLARRPQRLRPVHVHGAAARRSCPEVAATRRRLQPDPRIAATNNYYDV